MQTVTEKLVQMGMADRIITASQLDRILDGSQKARYGLVNRALKSGELLRFKRGVYALHGRYRKTPLHPFALAQGLVPGSYISFETALGFHGWIPEAVFTTVSALPGRKSKRYELQHGGLFTFHPLAVHNSCFLELVERKQIDSQTFLIAHPVRALMDLVCFRKESWQGIEWLTEGLRISPDHLASINRDEIRHLESVYLHKRVNTFLSALKEELFRD